MKNYIVAFICVLVVQVQYAGNMGFSLMLRPPLFNCGVKGCSYLKFSASPIRNIPEYSTKDSQVINGECVTEQHPIGYWAPRMTSIFIIAPMYGPAHNGNSYTAYDVMVISSFRRQNNNNIYAPIINWTHAQDPFSVQKNGNDDKGYAYYLYDYYLDTKHHDRTWPLFTVTDGRVTEISFEKLKAPVGTVLEYFNGTSVDGSTSAYWPLHMIDPGNDRYPDKSDKDGFNYFGSIKLLCTDYSKIYNDTGF